MVSLRYKTYFLYACLFGLVFIVFTYLVLKGLFLSTDSYIDQALPLTFNSPLYFISQGLAYLYFPLILVILVFFLRLVRSRQNHEAWVLLASTSGFVVSEIILKPIFRVQCPFTFYSNVLSGQGIFGWSKMLQRLALGETCYPSGHTASYVVFCGYLAYLALKYIKNEKLRTTLFITTLIIIVLIGPSRLYLHVHWFSDVIAGYLLGLSLLLFIISLHRYAEEKKR